MSGPNHIIGGIVFTGIYMSMFDQNIFSQPHFLFFTAFFAVLPDVDHTRSHIGKLFYPIAKYIDKKFGHRTITHSLVCYVGLALLVGLAEQVFFQSSVIVHLFIWAYGSHLIFDMMTLQGVPLFYPFRKNPCVIPGNPSFRFRSSDIKTEFIIFGLFIALGFSCINLFANGFWNTYNRQFNTIKHVHAESMIYDKALQVQFNITQNGYPKSGTAWLMEASTERLLLFEDSKGYTIITKTDKIQLVQPIRSQRIFQLQELYFNGISPDSLQQLLNNKPIHTLKLQCSLPMQYLKDNKPQSGTSIELEHVFNPVFTFSNVDSIDASVEKDMALLQLEIAKANQEQAAYLQEQHTLQTQLTAATQNLSSPDLATKEQATSTIAKLRTSLQQLKPPYNNKKALQARLSYLQNQLHVRKMQMVSGYVSWRE